MLVGKIPSLLLKLHIAPHIAHRRILLSARGFTQHADSCYGILTPNTARCLLLRRDVTATMVGWAGTGCTLIRTHVRRRVLVRWTFTPGTISTVSRVCKASHSAMTVDLWTYPTNRACPYCTRL